MILAWCGKNANIVENVCRDGPRAFRTTDPGYFGGESYFAVECAYASRYSSPKTAGGEYPVILFACCVSPLPYVITRKDDYDVPRCEVKGYSQFYAKVKEGSKSLMPRYNAHFVPVKDTFPFDFQACSNIDADGHELVLHHKWSLPIAVLWYKR